MRDTFATVIQHALMEYESQTPLYYYLTYYGSWVFMAVGVISGILVILHILKTGQFKPLGVVPILFVLLGVQGINTPRPNLAIFYGYNLLEIAYPAETAPETFLVEANFSNPVCCSIREAEYMEAKRVGFREYADAKAAILVNMVEMEREAKQAGSLGMP